MSCLYSCGTLDGAQLFTLVNQASRTPQSAQRIARSLRRLQEAEYIKGVRLGTANSITIRYAHSQKTNDWLEGGK